MAAPPLLRLADQRLHALDAVRGLALLLGIWLHAALSFLPGTGVWAVADVSRSSVLLGTVFVIHSFRMPTFFVLAGFFGRLLLQKYGAPGFVRNRTRRILVPLVVAWLACYPALTLLLGGVDDWAFNLRHGFRAGPGGGLAFPWMHLWFLYLLLILYVAVLALRGVIQSFDRDGARRAWLADRLRHLTESPWLVVALALPLALVLARVPGWTLWRGIPTPDRALLPQLAILVAYASAFALGWLAHRQGGLPAVWQRRWGLFLGTAAALTAVSLWLASTVQPSTVLADSGQKLLHAGVYALTVWTMTVAFIGGLTRLCTGASPLWRYAADASYFVYLAHLPVVLFLQKVLRHMPLHWSLKFPLVAVATLVVSVAVYHYLVRSRVLGRLLGERPGASGRPVAATMTYRPADVRRAPL